MGKIGHIFESLWFHFEDGEFSMHTAIGMKGEVTTFRVPRNEWPSMVAQDMGMQHKLLRNAREDEIHEWIVTHPHLRPQRIERVAA